MICPKCGTNNIDGSSFCLKCGTNLKEPQSISQNNDNSFVQNEQVMYYQQEQPPYQPMNDQQQNNYQQSNNNIQQPKKKNSAKLLIIIAIIVAFVVAGIIFFPKLFGNDGKNNTPESLTVSSSFWIKNNENLYALFDVNGRQLTKFNYKSVGSKFVNGTTYVKNTNDEYGIISENSKMIADFGKYPYISQTAGIYLVYDDNSSYLINSNGDVLYKLDKYSVTKYVGTSYLLLRNNDAYYVLNYSGKELTRIPIDISADYPDVDERYGYVLIFYNKKVYIIDPYSEKVVNTFDSDKDFSIDNVSKGGSILLKSGASWDMNNKKSYKIIKDNRAIDLPQECTSIYFDQSNENIVCENEEGMFLLNDNYQKGINISTSIYVNKVYSDNKGYVYERINSNNVVLSVDFVQNGNTVKSVSCRELTSNGYKANGLYILSKHYTAGCERETGGYYEYYNKNGEKMFGRSFDHARAFDKNNLAIVSESDTTGYSLINVNGVKVSNAYDRIDLSNISNYYTVMNNKMYGIVNEKGKEIVPCKYSKIDIINDNYAKFKTSDSKTIIFDLSKNKEILSLEDINSNLIFTENYIASTSGSKTKYYSYTTGKMFYEG